MPDDTEQTNEKNRKANLIELSDITNGPDFSKDSKQMDDPANSAKATHKQAQSKPTEYVITKVQAQKAKNRFNIYINDEYAFPVDDNLLVQHRLIKGKTLTEDEIEELREKGELSKGYQAALHFLNFKMRTEKEIRDYLIDKDYQSLEPIIQKLKDNRLINDEEYAKSFVRTYSTLKLEGPKKMERALAVKGLTKEEIMTGMDEYAYDLQVENARQLAEKVLNRQRNKSSKEMIQKVREQLMTKGFESDVIQLVLDELDTDQTDDEEYVALRNQGDKAWTRYARKHKGYDLKSRTKSYLYSKGYPRELIDQFIQEKEDEM